MKKHINQRDIILEVSQKTRIPQPIVEAFIEQMFRQIENNLVKGISSNVEGLGIFRVIKSGDTNKIIFLGSKKNIHHYYTKETIISQLPSKHIPKNTYQNTKVEKKEFPFPSTPPKKVVEEKTTPKTINTPFAQNQTIQQKNNRQVYNNNTYQTNNLGKQTYQNNTQNDYPYSPNKATTNSSYTPPQTDEITPKTNNINDALKDKQKKREEKKKLAIILPIITFLLLIIIAVGIYFIYFDKTQNNTTTEQEELYTVNFQELQANDTSLIYNCSIIPNKDVSLEYIANEYYGNKVFWPYIYLANEDFLSNSIIVKAGSIINLPKITVDLFEYNKGTVQKRADKIGDNILKTKHIY